MDRCIKHRPIKRHMIIFVKITIEELSRNGKKHKWERSFCDSCQRNRWGHGFVRRYFSEVFSEIYLKRYRCPGCVQVLTTRPVGYWLHLRSSILTIYEALKSKLKGLWPPGFPRQRGGHWLRRFVELSKIEMQGSLLLFLENCFAKQVHFFP